MRQRIARSAIDTSALRTHRTFRRVFGAQIVTQIGTQITVLALAFQVFSIVEPAHGAEKATLAVGLIGAAQIVPLVGFGLVAGAIADAVDRRLLLLVVQLGMCVVSAVLAVLALGVPPPLWSLYLLAAVAAALAAVDGPARTAIIPALVDDETLRSAVQLREVLTQSGRTFGPLLGGLLIGSVSLSTAYAVDAASFLFAFSRYLGLPPLIPANRRRFELSSITEALQFVGSKGQRVLACTFVADLTAMVFGMPRALFPAFGTTVFGMGSFGVGVLYAAPAAGALVGLFVVGGLTSRVRREGLGVLVAVALWGTFIAGFGLSPWFWPAVVLLALAGAADMISAIFRQTMLLAIVPDELRGRMSAVHIMVVTGGPPLGDIEAGATAELLGLRGSAIMGGLACVAGMGALGAAVPEFRRWVDPRRGATSAERQPA